MREPQLLTDIAIDVHHRELRPVYKVTTQKKWILGGEGLSFDMKPISDRQNLGQAVIIRLLTPRGELSALGHPRYGSRLHEIVGRTNTENTRDLARLFILESLKEEARIDSIEEVLIEESPGRRSTIDVHIRVIPIGATDSLTIGPIVLEI
jgi:phage baseplate assembly protein W